MMNRFEHRVALITGGASGIGRATALRLASAGATVVVADVQDMKAAAVVAEVEAAGGTAGAVHLDVTDEAGWTAAVADVLARFGRLDVLVNNAGIGDTAPIEDTEYATYRKVVDITSASVFLGQKAASKALHDSGNGAVVNISSMFGIVGGFGGGPGYAAKGAVRTLTKNTALGWATTGVRVNSVHPGSIDTSILGETDRNDARRGNAHGPARPGRRGRGRHRLPGQRRRIVRHRVRVRRGRRVRGALIGARPVRQDLQKRVSCMTPAPVPLRSEAVSRAPDRSGSSRPCSRSRVTSAQTSGSAVASSRA